MELPRRPTFAEIDLDALARNFRSVRSFVGQDVDYMAVVKANAYGHGSTKCAKVLEQEGISWFAVALVEEALELRKAGIERPILCLGGFWPGQEAEALARNLTPVVFTLDSVERLAAASPQSEIDIHLKIDTGMGRIGIRPNDLPEFLNSLSRFPRIRIEGVMTHFAAADAPEENEFTDRQIRDFFDAVAAIRSAGHEPRYIDLANSPGAVAHPASRGNLVRLGGILYGLIGDILPPHIPQPVVSPVLSWRTSIGQLKQISRGDTVGYGRSFRAERPTMIATLPVGYHDGLRRALSNRGHVIVNGQLAPIVGRISMDWTTVDVTGVPDVDVGTEVTILGSDGDSAILAEDMAGLLDTISYEITCGISYRVPRIYKNS
jgi:alanine racemase